ncbi:hypothetical protein ACOBQX_18035 [Actinokineospora sp. G85]|uniref:hypothetical protein n=1 Tax=Actinokineospora sp. G85 TaxID=3406626 RepID=UPI003C71BF78
MSIKITGADITDEPGLGPCYRIVQQSPQGIELYILPRSAVAADMELYGVDDPVRVLDWRLHGYRSPASSAPTSAPAVSLVLATQAQEAQAVAQYGRARLADGLATTRAHSLAHDLDQVDAEADRLKVEARKARDAEVAEIKAAVSIADDAGLATLRALVLADVDDIATDRMRYREQLTAAITA